MLSISDFWVDLTRITLYAVAVAFVGGFVRRTSRTTFGGGSCSYLG